jgi:hypothetical protein
VWIRPRHGLTAPGLMTLICPPGTEWAPISHGRTAYEAYREHGPGRGRWLVDVPLEAAGPLLRVGDFAIFDLTP